MKILVTGGAGFIGSHVVDKYITDGHDVFIIDNLSTGRIENINKKATFYKADIRDYEVVKDIICSNSIEVINHHAAQLDVRVSVTDPLNDAEINIIGLITLLEAFKNSSVEKKKFIYISSGGCIYGDAKCPINESNPIRPESPYGASKASGEYYLNVYCRLYGIKYTILRYSNVFGPRQDPKGEAGVIAIFIGNLLKNKKCFIFGTGEQIRDYVFVEDVVNANLSALESGDCDYFNIGTGIQTTVNQLFDSIIDVMDQNELKPEYKPERPGELFRNYLDYSKARSNLGWEPLKTLKEGLSLTYDYFKNYS